MTSAKNNYGINQLFESVANGIGPRVESAKEKEE